MPVALLQGVAPRLHWVVQQHQRPPPAEVLPAPRPEEPPEQGPPTVWGRIRPERAGMAEAEPGVGASPPGRGGGGRAEDPPAGGGREEGEDGAQAAAEGRGQQEEEEGEDRDGGGGGGEGRAWGWAEQGRRRPGGVGGPVGAPGQDLQVQPERRGAPPQLSQLRDRVHPQAEVGAAQVSQQSIA